MILTSKIILHSVQLLALVIVLLRWNELKKGTQHLFIYYMIFVAVIEISANITFRYYDWGNYLSYNIYDIGTYSFLLAWFHKILDNHKWVFLLGGAYIINLIISLSYEDIMTSYLNINVYSGTTIILLLTISYYVQLLKQKDLVYFLRLPEFWIATALLLFNIGYLPIHFLINFKVSFNSVSIQFMIMILNVFLYGFFIKGFLCKQSS